VILMDEQTSPAQQRRNARRPYTGWPYSRVLATLVLVPTVPMLLISVGALLLFYLAPVRFGDLLARLPGESFIRTALVFAPATLFAIVVLALLYAIEKPVEKPEVAIASRAREAQRSLLDWLPRLTLAVAIPLWLFSLGLWSLSFISPGRFDRLLAPLPGDSYLRPLVPFAPWVLFLIVIAAAGFVFTRPAGGGEAQGARGSAEVGFDGMLRPAITAVLVSALPALLGSFAALAVYWLRPDSFARVLEHLPFETIVRAGLVFVPPTSFVAVVLAAMYLLGTRKPDQATGAEEPARLRGASSLRSSLGMFVLTAGLSLSAALGLGLLGSLIYIILR
jgi:hypothetical protein